MNSKKSKVQKWVSGLALMGWVSLAAFCTPQEKSSQSFKTNDNMSMDLNNPSTELKTDTATFAIGCFWCTEAVFTELKGVLKVTSGYTGGQTDNPNYKEVCTGQTGHAECLQIIYDPAVISFDELLEVFWETHDPTTLNRQGNDVGTQYRSGIFYHNAEQKLKAEQYKAKLDKSGAFSAPIVTEITPAVKFYPAENYHQDYYAQNGSQPYCYYVIRPKVEKVRKVFKSKLKNSH